MFTSRRTGCSARLHTLEHGVQDSPIFNLFTLPRKGSFKAFFLWSTSKKHICRHSCNTLWSTCASSENSCSSLKAFALSTMPFMRKRRCSAFAKSHNVFLTVAMLAPVWSHLKISHAVRTSIGIPCGTGCTALK